MTAQPTIISNMNNDNHKPLTTTTTTNLPASIVLDKWEDSGFICSGLILPKQLPRLAELIDEAHQETPIQVVCELNKNSHVLWLTFKFDGQLWVTCQRCLAPLDITVNPETSLALLADESQQNLLADDSDFLLLDEIIESNNHRQRILPILALVEDELLLNIPISAKHEDCQMAVETVGDIVEEEAENPFAALAQLKGKLS